MAKTRKRTRRALRTAVATATATDAAIAVAEREFQAGIPKKCPGCGSVEHDGYYNERVNKPLKLVWRRCTCRDCGQRYDRRFQMV